MEGRVRFLRAPAICSPCGFFSLVSGMYINIHDYNHLWTTAGAKLLQSQTMDMAWILMNNFYIFLPQTDVKFNSMSVYGTCTLYLRRFN